MRTLVPKFHQINQVASIRPTFTSKLHLDPYPLLCPASMSTLKRKATDAAAKDVKKAKSDGTLNSFFGAPKSTTSTAAINGHKPAAGSFKDNPDSSTPPSKFDKDKWAATLTAEQKKLLKLEIDTLDPSWLLHLKDTVTSPGFLELKRFLQKEVDSGKKIFPPFEDVYSWSRHTPLYNVKAVILGQDPYHNHNQAHGLCFSVRPPTPAPPSLKNMYTALKKDYPSFTPPPKNGGLLTPWAEQGVLMLNTCLTVRAHEANSHSNKGWEAFTQKVIDTVVRVRNRGVVFLAWGTPAQKRCAGISGNKHLVLKSVHPSPLSAARGFFDCNHFKKTNDWLSTRYGEDGVIDWNLNVVKPSKGPDPAVIRGPIKVTSDQKDGSIEEDRANTEVPRIEVSQASDDAPKTTGKESVSAIDNEDEFEDEDALAAMQELATSSINGDGVDSNVGESFDDGKN